MIVTLEREEYERVTLKNREEYKRIKKRLPNPDVENDSVIGFSCFYYLLFYFDYFYFWDIN